MVLNQKGFILIDILLTIAALSLVIMGASGFMRATAQSLSIAKQYHATLMDAQNTLETALANQPFSENPTLKTLTFSITPTQKLEVLIVN